MHPRLKIIFYRNIVCVKMSSVNRALISAFYLVPSGQHASLTTCRVTHSRNSGQQEGDRRGGDHTLPPDGAEGVNFANILRAVFFNSLAL